MIPRAWGKNLLVIGPWRFRLVTDSNYMGGWSIKLLLGKGRWVGAGYINGLTLYLVRKGKGGKKAWRDSVWLYRTTPLQLGVTRNANHVPYLGY